MQQSIDVELLARFATAASAQGLRVLEATGVAVVEPGLQPEALVITSDCMPPGCG